MEEELTLEQMWALVREEIEPTNPPLSFTTRMFMKEFNLSKSQAHRHLTRLFEEGRIIKIDKYYSKDKKGRNNAIPGWQWITP